MWAYRFRLAGGRHPEFGPATIGPDIDSLTWSSLHPTWVFDFGIGRRYPGFIATIDNVVFHCVVAAFEASRVHGFCFDYGAQH